MKGEIFLGFVDLVEQKFGPEVADRLLSDPSLKSRGAYTRVGTYDHGEIVHMVVLLSQQMARDPAGLQRIFGAHLFEKLVDWHMDFVETHRDAFSLLASIDDTIHVQVRKLYPDADLPKITVTRESDDVMLIDYASDRGLAHVCHGLIQGCISYFNEGITLSRRDISKGPLDTTASFCLERVRHD